MMYKGRIFVLQSDWAILEYNDYMAIGSGTESAMGSLYTLYNLDTKIDNKEISKISIQAASNHILSVGGGIDTITLKY